MRYSVEQLQAIAPEALDGRSPKEYVESGVRKLLEWLGADPHNQRWKRFGPYWPGVKELLDEYAPGNSLTPSWGEVPDYLQPYNYKADALNLLAAVLYLNRDGDYVNAVEDHPHSIEMPNGDIRLYVPGSGLLDRDG
ncbi:MAG: hypothetical protein O2890_12695 [Cyanobacteria bacterium]|nr:hypothetical protein [Cyanobacteriota bacterium]